MWMWNIKLGIQLKEAKYFFHSKVGYCLTLSDKNNVPKNAHFLPFLNVDMQHYLSKNFSRSTLNCTFSHIILSYLKLLLGFMAAPSAPMRSSLVRLTVRLTASSCMRSWRSMTRCIKKQHWLMLNDRPWVKPRKQLQAVVSWPWLRLG